MNHRVKFLLLVLGLLLLVASNMACTLANDIQHDSQAIWEQAKDVTEDVLQIAPCKPGDGMCFGDILNEANEYGQKGGKK